MFEWTSTFLNYLIPFLFVLTIVVFVHEMGHFLVARACGVKVETFSIGFGPEIYAFFDRYGTRWRLAAVPLGGYVKFYGDADGASAPSPEMLASMSAAERRLSFHGQPVANRAAIVVAGPMANFILAIAFFTSIFMISGRDVLLPRVSSVVAGDAADQAGFKPGDVIVSIDGKAINSWLEMQRIVQASADIPLNFVLRRDDKEIATIATPRLRDIETGFGKNRAGILGVSASSLPQDWIRQEMGLKDSLIGAFGETWFIIERTGSYLGGLFTGRESAEQISGPIRIAEISGKVASIGLLALLNLAAILSVSIGLINLVPIPMLDGGHLLFYFFEAIRGRPLSERTQELSFKVGMALVGGFMIFATINDILHFTKI
jgi:regulator of sigma E protease